ncbi:DVU_1553 family AMP-dependent CoA ligase [Desulfofustis glycolicus]|uniref:Phenylacetate-coenzyme A ligase PaaK, adenylate-forming domain family n=1 Tax=Desulfofustis glycolicus DSM 9705 TaxID=1121409 RepID=A0A1M5YHT0_9BACT|nr:AMP-binding protein [Desulfofustis glycolicus]MCB2214817.1 AMP-binding protein [Desulfobulbaceae bacterium]SHI11590.1 Phenylacetate-coenzyme A ligase PaaK, adenylate-forming domain family [Desulfofustis glycolicus DSM 9705]
MVITPLEAWIKDAIGASPAPAVVWKYQRALLCKTLAWAKENSIFYANRLRDIDPWSIHTPMDLARIPTTTPEELRGRDHEFLCLSQGDIARVVTLASSGTTGESKRVHFSAEDLNRTVDFFHRGMSTFTIPGNRVLIFMPGERPGSVGDLLCTGLEKLGANGVVHGPVLDPDAALQHMHDLSPQVIVGIPVHVLALASRDRSAGGSVHSVLLCSDNVPRSLVATVEKAWSCRVFTHWGMSETGLGGGVECEAREGYHLRETDLYLETIDPATGAQLPSGREGEVVVTTLTRRGMPLIRYRSGDLAALLTFPCPCGSQLRRLSRIRKRVGEQVELPSGKVFYLAELDEVLFSVPCLEDYGARLLPTTPKFVLEVKVRSSPGTGAWFLGEACLAIEKFFSDSDIPSNELTLNLTLDNSGVMAGMAKRRIIGLRGLDA